MPLEPFQLVAGIDEAGRGCLAGPVYAAAVILHEGASIIGLDDSKKLSPKRRESLLDEILRRARAWGVGCADVGEVDQLNIERASWLAMTRAMQALNPQPQQCWVDGNRAPEMGVPVRAIVGGDALEPCIMAASILAKVARDAEMRRLDKVFPGYGFSDHKGYGTREHFAALDRLGPTTIHRMSFRPCIQAGLRFDASMSAAAAGS